MSNVFYGEGNIGTEPEARFTPAGKAVLTFSVYFDNPVKQHDGSYVDKGGFWVRVENWTDHAEDWSKMYQKGMRVMVTGRLRREEWRNDHGELQVTMRMSARNIGILPYRIETISMKAKNGESQPPAPQAHSSVPDFDDDIPF